MASYTVYVFILIGLCLAAKNEKSGREFLEKEKKKLVTEKIICSLKKITLRTLDNQRLTDKATKVLPCYIDALLENPKDWKKWTILGDLYERDSKTTQASFCFKLASKLKGPLNTYIDDWSFIGPFVIGKIEWDGDPLEAYGGIRNVSKYRYRKGEHFYSELVKDAVIEWKTFKQNSGDNGIQISPTVQWNDLINSLGSVGITEWQGWLLGELYINERDQNVLIQCLGIHTVYIDDVPVASDVYHREKFWFGVHLSRGVHTVYIHLRTKVTATKKCTFQVDSSPVRVLEPQFLPDIINGYLFSKYISIPISNYHHSKWVKVTKISSAQVEVALENPFNIAPGQTAHIPVKFNIENNISSKDCEQFHLTLKIITSEGVYSLPLRLRCRKSGQSFLFTFLDHDGSIQQAAAVEPIKQCDSKLCPVLLTLHGTTVPPQNQADSYKRMENGEYIFGVDRAWLLAPTRHGAHNWEGPGALTALSALFSLGDLIKRHNWISQKIDPNRVIYAGHSMGGHGAWHLASHYPDRSLGLVTLAGWIKKEEYGDSNLFFRHDISASHVDPAIKFILEACIAENDVDRHITNIKDVPILARIGADDRTVHPFFVRRMHRLMKEIKANVTYVEVTGKEHWWWDTKETNDGGVVNDQQIRDFTNARFAEEQSHCQLVDGERDCSEGKVNMYTREDIRNFTLVTYNPALGDGLNGVQILQQIVPMRTSKIRGSISKDLFDLETVNVARFSIQEPPNRKTNFKQKVLKVDGNKIGVLKEKHSKVNLCQTKGNWKLCDERNLLGRNSSTYGPARRVAEHKFVIVIGTLGSPEISARLQSAAVYIANLFLLTSDTTVQIIKDIDVDPETVEDSNLIILGSEEENLLSISFLDEIPIKVKEQSFGLENCQFHEKRMGLLTLAPHGKSRLALLILGNSVEGLMDVISLATPTIPPMTRSPFSNLLPDYVITGQDFKLKGPGGFLCAGFYGNNWEYRHEISSCVC
ncbi:uncharacterized protein LOC133183060 [Saccostrea echinata]|uniref:uncharacterized protein LOC133183060 n=1 Tax=Saccostrea echinata TaxID=191078 RepID=UPI002A80FF22|nr:uncharacterized protein LOC133183060 [Saccostrea echinata]